ncbi:hypothetical protein [Amycolatopsis sp. Hca4]|uniref:hypothetical protein n=1 Tax=Amycolatopsis sp. Hca4 TaxID=2742131 RepID=UPI001590D5EC|nr:hypothetical protein [Amycolatopsis sp. Hca4]QKV78285.1 hypothetical protein HUT10_34275 [Amycolatopsis sp. Hca4]
MGQKTAANPVPPWTQRDEVLWYTCYLAALLAGGQSTQDVHEVLAPFPPTIGGDEKFWACGSFVLSDFRALGDGSWQVSTPVVFGTGAVGLGLVAGTLVGGSIAKSRARRAAQAAAVPRWVPIEQGNVYLSQYGFYMHTPSVLRWPWTDISGLSVVAPATVHFSGNSEHGPISWMLQSDWAELLFVSWALAVHPRHPQLVTGGWLPPGWVEHARFHQRAPRAAPGAGIPGIAAPEAPETPGQAG